MPSDTILWPYVNQEEFPDFVNRNTLWAEYPNKLGKLLRRVQEVYQHSAYVITGDFRTPTFFCQITKAMTGKNGIVQTLNQQAATTFTQTDNNHLYRRPYAFTYIFRLGDYDPEIKRQFSQGLLLKQHSSVFVSCALSENNLFINNDSAKEQSLRHHSQLSHNLYLDTDAQTITVHGWWWCPFYNLAAADPNGATGKGFSWNSSDPYYKERARFASGELNINIALIIQDAY